MKTKLLLSIFILISLFSNSQNLVAYYPFNGNANDESGNGNNGTVNGATLTTDRFGKPNKAYYFDGVDDFIQCLYPGPIGANPRTISFWAKTNVLPTNHSNVVLSYGGESSSFSYGDRIEVSINSNNKRGPVLSIGGSILVRELDNSDNDWHFYTIVFEGGTNKHIADFKMYGDGQLLTNTSVLIGNSYTVNTQETPIYIGYLPNIGRYFNGSIDEIKIYNYALSNDDIKEEYRNLVAYYPFNGNANDESGNDNHGIVNGATLTTDRFGNANSAYSFDGNDIITVPYNQILDSDNELTISVWVKPNLPQNSLILGKSNWWWETNYLLRTKLDGYLQFEYRDMAYNNTNPLIVNEWNHIAVVSDINNIKKIYINNTLATHTGGVSPFNTVHEVLTIGGAGASGYNAEYFNGVIDDLRIYKSTLTVSEIGSLFTNNTLKIKNIEDVSNSAFYFYNNKLHFKNTQNLNEIKNVHVYNLLGQKVFKTSKIEQEITLSEIKNGLYIIKISKTNNQNQSFKILIH